MGSSERMEVSYPTISDFKSERQVKNILEMEIESYTNYSTGATRKKSKNKKIYY